jgi:hypothetical protein
VEEVFLWNVLIENNTVSVGQFEKVHQTETEAILEEILVKSPELLFPGLKLVSRQSETTGGPLDLLGVDEDGSLVVFELKRGSLTRDAVAQVIDYGSYLSELEPNELSAHISANSGKLGIDEIQDFAAWYQEQFATPVVGRMYPRLVLVGLGVDDRTRRMVSFLADSEIDISLITFHAFKDGNRILLARQVEVQAKPVTEAGVSSKKNNLEKLNAKLQKMRLTDFFRYTSDFVLENMPQAYAWPNQNGYTYYLQETTESGSPTNRAYLSISLNETKGSMLQLYIHPRAIESDSEADVRTMMDALGMTKRKDGAHEKWIASLEKWKEDEDKYKQLLDAVLGGWKRKREKLAKSDISET